MSLWLEQAGSRLEIVDGSLDFIDAKGASTRYGKVAVDVAPTARLAALAKAVSTGEVGPVVPFFVKLPWGMQGPFCELISIGATQLLILSAPAGSDYWYVRPFSRLLLVETADAIELIDRMRSYQGSSLLQATSPTNGAYIHHAQLGKARQVSAAWHGRAFVESRAHAVLGGAGKLTSTVCPSFEAASVALARWIVARLREGHPIIRVETGLGQEKLAMTKPELAELDAALGPKATKAAARARLKQRKGN